MTRIRKVSEHLPGVRTHDDLSSRHKRNLTKLTAPAVFPCFCAQKRSYANSCKMPFSVYVTRRTGVPSAEKGCERSCGSAGAE